MILGTLWYGPLFGKLWLRMIGKKAEEMNSNPAMYIITLITAFAGSLVLAILVNSLGISTWFWGLVAGAVVWVGIGFTGLVSTSIFNETKFGVVLLFGIYQLIVYLAEGLVFAIW
jgi:hypothetical protein